MKTEKEKIKLVDQSQKVEELGFWELIEKAAKEILSPEETQKFMDAIRKVIVITLTLLPSFNSLCVFLLSFPSFVALELQRCSRFN